MLNLLTFCGAHNDALVAEIKSRGLWDLVPLTRSEFNEYCRWLGREDSLRAFSPFHFAACCLIHLRLDLARTCPRTTPAPETCTLCGLSSRVALHWLSVAGDCAAQAAAALLKTNTVVTLSGRASVPASPIPLPPQTKKEKHMTKRPTPLSQIETAAAELNIERGYLSHHVAELNAEIEAAKRRHLPVIKKFVARCSECHADLTNLIDANRALFVRPRTYIFHGIKLGLEKGKGKIEIPDPARTLELIKKFHPDHGVALIHVTESPNKEALADLDVAELRKIGAGIAGIGDQILIKFTDSAVDKAVKALLKDAIDDATNQQAA